MRARDETAIQQVVQEVCTLLGAGRAILLQVAHPKVAQGVAEHSRFAEKPLKRLRGTLDYVYAITLGTPEESAAIADTVNRIHTYVKGAGYSAKDPELQLWVAATLYKNSLHLYESTLGPMPAEKREEFCREASVFSTLLGCPEDMWPSSVTEFEEYWDREMASLVISEEAKRICRDLLYNRALPWYLRPLQPANRFVTTGLLPERMRDEFGLIWDPRRERVFRFGARVARSTYPRVPLGVRRLPVALYMRYFRRRFGANA
ncbi:DUF2236 domain-containing protein [Catenulispora sp. NF23]|uniref:oxygenase MpaB family protein n=1 Tax=Catenulispora pinistramenti TaxID=2705254 RepID=UPI001BA78CCD|nr:oxygenase MpaB family protein [Catenulispora pinistramenti]MBS2533033.1 DUF2236 domain-containing protein [Catenulispora pinistramenti]